MFHQLVAFYEPYNVHCSKLTIIKVVVLYKGENVIFLFLNGHEVEVSYEKNNTKPVFRTEHKLKGDLNQY